MYKWDGKTIKGTIPLGVDVSSLKLPIPLSPFSDPIVLTCEVCGDDFVPI